MNKLSFILLLGFVLSIISCEKSTELSESDFTEQIETTQKKFVDVKLPNGKIVAIPVPDEVEQLQNPESATSRAAGCGSIFTFYAYPNINDPVQCNNLDLFVNVGHPTNCGSLPSNRCKTYHRRLSDSWSTGNMIMEDQDVVTLQYLAQGVSCVNFTLLIMHWDCSGGTVSFLDFCDNTPIGQLNEILLGTVVECNGKCTFQMNQNYSSALSACASCSTDFEQCPR